jgi:hypothetical protein
MDARQKEDRMELLRTQAGYLIAMEAVEKAIPEALRACGERQRVAPSPYNAWREEALRSIARTS